MKFYQKIYESSGQSVSFSEQFFCKFFKLLPLKLKIFILFYFFDCIQ